MWLTPIAAASWPSRLSPKDGARPGAQGCARAYRSDTTQQTAGERGAGARNGAPGQRAHGGNPSSADLGAASAHTDKLRALYQQLALVVAE